MGLGGLLFMDCGPDPGIAPPSKLFGIRAGADFVVVSSFVATRCGQNLFPLPAMQISSDPKDSNGTAECLNTS